MDSSFVQVLKVDFLIVIMAFLIINPIIIIKVVRNFNSIIPSFMKDSFNLVTIQVHQVLTYNSIIATVMGYSSFIIVLKMLNDSVIVIVIREVAIIKANIIVKLIIKEHYRTRAAFGKGNLDSYVGMSLKVLELVY